MQTEYSIHMSVGDSTTIHADNDAEAMMAAEEIAQETGSDSVEVYRVDTHAMGFDSVDTLTYIGSR